MYILFYIYFIQKQEPDKNPEKGTGKKKELLIPILILEERREKKYVGKESLSPSFVTCIYMTSSTERKNVSSFSLFKNLRGMLNKTYYSRNRISCRTCTPVFSAPLSLFSFAPPPLEIIIYWYTDKEEKMSI